jgi:hypothetical protein
MLVVEVGEVDMELLVELVEVVVMGRRRRM